MATYVYECPEGHLTELMMGMASDKPESVICEFEYGNGCQGPPEPCGAAAARVFLPPAAIHYKGPGFYETDYRGKFDRKRRKNAGDGLPLPIEAAIGRAEGAEHDPDPRSLAGGVIER